MSETQPTIICVKGIKTDNIWLFLQMFIIFAIVCNVNLAPQRHKRGAREPCAESLKTVTTVKSCPKNKDSWERKAKLKNCEDVPRNCSNDFVYHCVLDEFGSSLIELCATATEIIGRFCAEFSSGGMFVQEHVEKQCKSCPFAYNSNMSYLYNECYELPELTTVIESTTKRQRQTTQGLYLNTTLRHMDDEAKPEFNYSIVISIALGLLASILSIAVLIIIYNRKANEKAESLQPNLIDNSMKLQGRIASPRDHLSSSPLMSSATPMKGEVDSPVEEHRSMITLHSNLQEDVNNRLDVNEE